VLGRFIRNFPKSLPPLYLRKRLCKCRLCQSCTSQSFTRNVSFSRTRTYLSGGSSRVQESTEVDPSRAYQKHSRSSASLGRSPRRRSVDCKSWFFLALLQPLIRTSQGQWSNQVELVLCAPTKVQDVVFNMKKALRGICGAFPEVTGPVPSNLYEPVDALCRAILAARVTTSSSASSVVSASTATTANSQPTDTSSGSNDVVVRFLRVSNAAFFAQSHFLCVCLLSYIRMSTRLVYVVHFPRPSET
jgi:hypothetical protein